MTEQTDHHEWTIPTPGATVTWASVLNDFFDELDREVVMADTESNRPAAGSDAPILFFATDQVRFDYNDGSSWTEGVYTDADAVSAVESEDPLDLQLIITREIHVNSTGPTDQPGFFFLDSSEEQQTAFVYDEDVDHTLLQINDPDGNPETYIDINHATTNGPHFTKGVTTTESGGMLIGGNDVPFSSEGQYDIQKDGTDGEGIINFKTS